MHIKEPKSLAYKTLSRFLPILAIAGIIIGSFLGFTLAKLEQQKETIELASRTKHFFYQLEKIRMRHLHSKIAFDIQKIVGADAVALYGQNCNALAVSPGNFLSTLKTCDKARTAIPQAVFFSVEDLSGEITQVLVFKSFPIGESLFQAFLYLITFVVLASMAAIFTVRFFANTILAQAVRDLIKIADNKSISREVSPELVPIATLLFEFHSELTIRGVEKAELARTSAIASTVQMLAHDLRSPLGAIDEVLKASELSSAPTLQNQGKRAISRIYSLIQSLRHSELEMIVRPNNAALDISEILQEVFITNREFESEFSRSQLFFVDKEKIERAIINLLQNAKDVDASACKLRLCAVGKDLVIEIMDNGIGVPQEILPRLFERGATHGKTDGTGLGLNYCKRITEGHGGSMEHVRKDSWTTFRMTFPYAIVPQTTSLLNISTETANLSEVQENILKTTPELRSGVIIKLKNTEQAKILFELIASEGTEPILSVYNDIASAKAIITDDVELVARALQSGCVLVSATELDEAPELVRRLKWRLKQVLSRNI